MADTLTPKLPSQLDAAGALSGGDIVVVEQAVLPVRQTTLEALKTWYNDGTQPFNAGLTAIALLSTTAYGRSLLEMATATAGRTALGLGSAAVLSAGGANGVATLGSDSKLTAGQLPDLAHASLTGVQGGVTGERYHLNSAQYDNLTGGSPLFAGAVMAGSVLTDSPAGETAHPWKFGSVTNRYATLDIAGTNYYMNTQGSTIIQLDVKNITVVTSDAPADIATVSIPSWVTRYMFAGGTGPGAISALTIIAETADGTLGAATFQLRTASGGGGALLSSNIAGPVAANAITFASNIFFAGLTASTLYLHQATDSANAGTISIYIYIMPLL